MRPIKVLTVVDSHTAGEPTRVVIGGLPHIPGRDMREKKRWLADHRDSLRRLLMREPRGHRDMFGALVTAPASPETDVGVIFMDNDGYLDMCVHGAIGTVTVLLELGMIDSLELTLDTPAGKVLAKAELNEDGVERVTIRNVPSFFHSTVTLKISGFGKVRADIAYGGNFFALIDLAELGLTPSLENLNRLIELGTAAKRVANEQVRITDPQSGERGRIELVELYDERQAPPKNIVVFGAGQFDRSPCGTGTSAKLALLYSQGRLKLGEEYRYRSIIDTEFIGKIADEVAVGPYRAIVPEITGSAYVTGIGQLILDKNDPFNEGFM